MGLNKRDKIAYVINSDETVTITRSQASEEDLILGKFLDFLAKDIEQNPQHIQPVTSKTLELQSLVANVEVDLNAPLPYIESVK